MPYTDQFKIKDNELELRVRGRFPFDRAAALFQFQSEGLVQEVLYALKYRRKPLVGKILGRQYAHKLSLVENFPIPDLIIPIPLHESKQQKRGYNQSQKFAEGIAEVLGKPVASDILIKTQKSESQTTKGRSERLENVLNSFKIKNKKLLINKKILLVDDVITTGATIEAAAIKIQEEKSVALSLGLIAMKLKI